jgi:hypothetical protein
VKEAAMLTRLTSAAALAASLVLAACGGGYGDGLVAPPPAPPAPPVITAVPDTAIATSAAFVGFLNGQSFSDEASEPLTLPAGDPATGETDEPLTV